jgi:hypothetical protein
MINEVRNTVLSVLNKNNYGYISPSDFNLFAENAQMELFEEYFSNYNKAINMENSRMAGSDYAEIEGPIAETLEGFLVTDFLLNSASSPLLPSSNSFFTPSLVTTGSTAYYILKMLCHTKVINAGTNSSVVVNSLISSLGQFTTLGILPGDIVVNVNTKKTAKVVVVSSNTEIILDTDIFLTTPVNYLIISQESKEAEKVSVGKIGLLNSSLLTQPSNIFPAYTLEGGLISLYPKTINQFGQVESTYFRHPKVPKWTFITIASGTPVFDQSQSDYQDFELPYEDIYRLTTKILQYAGISIRESEVAQYGMIQEQQQNQ